MKTSKILGKIKLLKSISEINVLLRLLNIELTLEK